MLRRARNRLAMRGAPPPAVCFGIGGSGTRAIAAIMEEAGLYIGPDQNRAKDARTMKPFLRRWPEDYLAQSRWVEKALEEQDRRTGTVPPGHTPGTLLPEPDPAMVADLEEAIRAGREGIPSREAPWGWKAPRTILVMPLIDRVFPGVRTIQLVRDGRDLAYSKNQSQVEAVGHVVIPEVPEDAPGPIRSIAFWSRMNMAAAAYGRAHMGERHLVIGFEDVCADPEAGMRRILGHIGIEGSAELVARASDLVETPGSIGRWQDQDPAEAELVCEAGSEGLAAFGYR
jgi:hypothetical protein